MLESIFVGAFMVAFVTGLLGLCVVVLKQHQAERRRLAAQAPALLEALRADVAPLGWTAEISEDGWIPSAVATGRLHGVYVRLERGWFAEEDGPTLRRSRVSVVRATREDWLGIGLESGLSLAAQELSGRMDLQCGAPDLDNLFSFTSQQPRLATAALRHPEFQAALRALVESTAYGRFLVIGPEGGSLLEPDAADLDVLDALARFVALRDGLADRLVAEACAVPGLARVEGAVPVAFAGALAGASVEVRPAERDRGIYITARPKEPWPEGLRIHSTEAGEQKDGHRAVRTRDPIVDRVLQVQAPTEGALDFPPVDDALRDAMLGALRSHGDAGVEAGHVWSRVASFDPDEVGAAAADAAALAAALGAAFAGSSRGA